MSGKPCSSKGCPIEAKFSPLIRIWPEGDTSLKEEKSLCIRLDLAFCAEHARFMGENSCITDEEWLNICSGLEELNQFFPSRRSARLELEACEGERSVFLNDKNSPTH